MVISIKKILFFLSVAFNFIMLLFLVFVSTRKASHISFFDLTTKDTRYIQSAFIISVPANDADLSFGPAEFSLRQGTASTLQYALLRDNTQSNLAMEPLYDHTVVSVEKSGFGLIIRGIAPGTAVLQLFSLDGFKDIAYVTVYE